MECIVNMAIAQVFNEGNTGKDYRIFQTAVDSKKKKTGLSCLQAPSQNVDLPVSTSTPFYHKKGSPDQELILHLPPSETCTVFPVAAPFPSSAEAAESSCD